MMRQFCSCCALGGVIGLAITTLGAAWILLYGPDSDQRLIHL